MYQKKMSKKRKMRAVSSAVCAETCVLRYYYICVLRYYYICVLRYYYICVLSCYYIL
jgi:hypothetical protein